jgi:hypothetical protein
MALYMIGYDPAKGGVSKELTQAIQNLGTWWRGLDSTWLVVHPGPAESIKNTLAPYIENETIPGGDRLLVSKLTGEMAWTDSFNKQCRDWLLNNQNNLD